MRATAKKPAAAAAKPNPLTSAVFADGCGAAWDGDGVKAAEWEGVAADGVGGGGKCALVGERDGDVVGVDFGAGAWVHKLGLAEGE